MGVRATKLFLSQLFKCDSPPILWFSDAPFAIAFSFSFPFHACAVHFWIWRLSPSQLLVLSSTWRVSYRHRPFQRHPSAHFVRPLPHHLLGHKTYLVGRWTNSYCPLLHRIPAPLRSVIIVIPQRTSKTASKSISAPTAVPIAAVYTHRNLLAFYTKM